MHFLIINGPNLNLLGTRETPIYGTQTLDDIMTSVTQMAKTHGIEVTAVQSNHEGVIIDHVQAAISKYDGIILNPAGYGHTSVALRDALLAVNCPTIEIHLTNLARREEFRHRTLKAAACVGQISGCGAYGYQLAVLALLNHLSQ